MALVVIIVSSLIGAVSGLAFIFAFGGSVLGGIGVHFAVSLGLSALAGLIAWLRSSLAADTVDEAALDAQWQQSDDAAERSRMEMFEEQMATPLDEADPKDKTGRKSA